MFPDWWAGAWEIVVEQVVVVEVVAVAAAVAVVIVVVVNIITIHGTRSLWAARLLTAGRGCAGGRRAPRAAPGLPACFRASANREDTNFTFIASTAIDINSWSVH